MQTEHPDTLDRLSRLAAASPEQPLLIVPAKPGAISLTAGALQRESEGLASGLTRAGVRAGDTVLIGMPAVPEALSLTVACWKIGAVAAWPEPEADAAQWLSFIERAAPRVLVGSSHIHAWATLRGRRAMRSVEIRVTDGWRWFWRGPTLQGLPSAPPPPPPPPSRDALVLLEIAGDKVLPVMLGHATLCERADQLASIAEISRGDRLVLTEPSLLLPAILAGACAVLPDRAEIRGTSALAISNVIREHRADHLVCSAPLYRAIAGLPPELKSGLDSLRTAVLLSARLTRADIDDLARISPSCRLRSAWGDIEAWPFAVLRAEDLTEADLEQTALGRGWCAGRPLKGRWLRVTRAVEGPIYHWATRAALADNDLGEVVVDDTAAVSGYPGDDARSREIKIQYGTRALHRTGWLGVLRPDGRLWLSGQISRSNGALGPCPEAIEAALDRLPGIASVALVQGDPKVLWVQMAPWARLDARLEAEIRARLAKTPLGASVGPIVERTLTARHPASLSGRCR